MSYPEAGSPQGGVISPMLANVYLHYVLDEWFAKEVKQRLKGRANLIRYADDFVIGFTHEEDARRVMAVLPKRFGRFGLAIHPDKTRLVPFRPPSHRKDDTSSPPGSGDTDGRPGTFDLLGFTHYWAISCKGNWTVKRKTASSRLSRAMRSIADWCRKNRHLPIGEQQRILSQKLRGHYAYYGITGNNSALSGFRTAVVRCWREWLNRRNRERSMTWEIFTGLLARYPLPMARVVHSVYTSSKR